MSTKLMPQGYFDSIQKEMVKSGFTLISRLSIDSTECEYHVEAKVARETSLFFHVRGKSVIFKLSYHEYQRYLTDAQDALEECRGYWTVDLYVRFLPYRTLLDQNPAWLDRDISMDDTSYGDMPIFGSTPLTLEGFTNGSGHGLKMDTENVQAGISFEQVGGYSTERLDPVLFATCLRKMYSEVEKYLDRNPFYGIQLTGFVPYYTFCGQHQHRNKFAEEKLERLFWSKFDWDYFRHLVKKPWGYNYRKPIQQPY